MGMNIKNEETHRLARELAALTGESQTAAITQALRERLERLRQIPEESLKERLLRFGEECAPHWREPYKSAEHGDLLYDDKGLPT